MKVGLIPQFYGADSLKFVWASIEKALSDRHEVIYRPLEYFNALKNRQPEILKDLFDRCDVLMGHIEKEVLECREGFGKPLPLIGVLFGTMSRGAPDLVDATQYLKTTDLLVGNCTSDLEIARKFFNNAEMRSLPFIYDESNFYRLGAPERAAIKAKMGLAETDRVLLYAGRVTLEKNVHGVLSIFRVLQGLIPDLHLIVVGDGWDTPFRELGVYTFGMTGVLRRLGHKLGIDENRVHVVRGVGANVLRNLYNVADVSINFTLHHDENFGLSQVESMACGTPVVGTRWGGLKDKIGRSHV
jgi:glycosyltransferase involved in cell wall biosynthesis